MTPTVAFFVGYFVGAAAVFFAVAFGQAAEESERHDALLALTLSAERELRSLTLRGVEPYTPTSGSLPYGGSSVVNIAEYRRCHRAGPNGGKSA